MNRIAITILAGLIVATISGCTGLGRSPDTGAIPAGTLPALDFDREASVTTTAQLDGSDFLLKSASASVDADELELFSTLQDPSWGIWQLTPGNAELVDVQLLMDIPDGSQAFYALANYSTGRWDFGGPTDSSLTVGLDPVDNLSPVGNAHVAVLAADADNLNVVRLILTTDRVGWQYTVFDDRIGAGYRPVPLDIGGKPAIAYLRSVSGGDVQLIFAYCETTYGIDTEDWTQVLVHEGLLSPSLDAAIVSGNPALVFRLEDPDELWYVRSTSADGKLGTDWSVKVPVAAGPGVGRNPGLAVSGGKPSIVYTNEDTEGVFFVRSANALGTSGLDWSIRRTLQTDGGFTLGITEVSGNPGVAYADATGILAYRRSAGIDGSELDDWNNEVLLDVGGYNGGNPALLLADGNPAIAYSGLAPDTLRYRRSSTTGGAVSTDWSDIVSLESQTVFISPAAAIINGNPAVSYVTVPGYEVVYRRSSNATGIDASWTREDVIPGLHLAQRADIRMTEVAGRPVICFYDYISGLGYYATFVE